MKIAIDVSATSGSLVTMSAWAYTDKYQLSLIFHGVDDSARATEDDLYTVDGSEQKNLTFNSGGYVENASVVEFVLIDRKSHKIVAVSSFNVSFSVVSQVIPVLNEEHKVVKDFTLLQFGSGKNAKALTFDGPGFFHVRY